MQTKGASNDSVLSASQINKNHNKNSSNEQDMGHEKHGFFLSLSVKTSFAARKSGLRPVKKI